METQPRWKIRKSYGSTDTKRGGRREAQAGPCRLHGGTDECDTCTRAHPSEPQAEDRQAGLEGARAPGPTHHERRGAQGRAAGGSMPRASGAPRDLGRRLRRSGRSGRGRQAAQSRADAAPLIRALRFGASGLAGGDPGRWGGRSRQLGKVAGRPRGTWHADAGARSAPPTDRGLAAHIRAFSCTLSRDIAGECTLSRTSQHPTPQPSSACRTF